MLVYHGTTLEIKEPKIITSEIGRDFGFAFYTTEFDGASMEWLDMVVSCRSDLNFRHDHDIVIGKIANDNVGETVSYVVQGIMRKEDAVERLKFEKINNQIAFCSERSLQQLRFIKSYIVEV